MTQWHNCFVTWASMLAWHMYIGVLDTERMPPTEDSRSMTLSARVSERRFDLVCVCVLGANSGGEPRGLLPCKHEWAMAAELGATSTEFGRC